MTMYQDRDRLSGQVKDETGKIDLRNEIQEAYRSHPVPWFRWVFAQLHLPENSRILEVGAGSGQLWQENRAAMPRGWQVILTDLEPEMVMNARNHLHPPAACLAVDSQRLPFPDRRFDAVLAIGVLDLVPRIDEALSEAQRVLRPGGLFVASAGGQAHLKELRDLLRPYLPGGQAERLGGAEERFGLENGQSRLAAYFNPVRRRDYQDTLRFTELQPVLDYVLSEDSVVWNLRMDHLARLVAQVKRRLAKNGEVQVTVQKGLFIARKPADPSQQVG